MHTLLTIQRNYNKLLLSAMDYLLELVVQEMIDLAEPRPLAEAPKYFQWMIGLV